MNLSKIRFEVGESAYDGTNGTINISVNGADQEKTSSVILSKIDAENGKALKNAYYTLYKKINGDWKVVQDALKTNAAGEIIIDSLKFGEYKFKETMPPAGYQLSAEEPDFTLDADNAGGTIQIFHKDERKLGTAQLVKTDKDGVPLAGAVFSLYKENSEMPIAEHLITDENGMTSEITGLSWGNYYYKETKAPLGYIKDSKQYKFTINAESADIPQKIRVINSRQLGTVVLAKMDEATKSVPLSGAVFTLYNSDGTVIKTDLVTREDGTVTVNRLDWGNYYFEETKAPEGYSLSAAKIRFSVNAENVASVQRVTCYDPIGLAELTIHKKINETYEAFGNAQFVFEVKGTDVSGNDHTYTRTLTITEDKTGTVTIAGIPAGTYTIRELGIGRYKQEHVIGNLNATVNPDEGTVTATLAAAGKAEVTFENRIEQYEKFSHNAGAMNTVNAKAQITGLRVTYTGPEILKAGTGNYSFTSKNVSAVVLYDDGTVKSVPFLALTITPSAISTQYGGAYTVSVSYTESGITVSDEFAITVQLEKPEGSLTVTYHANGGYFGNDPARTVNQVNYKEQNGTMTAISGTEMEPQCPDKIFDGWYLDADCTDGNKFQGTESLTEDIVVYAKYKEGIAKIDSSKFADGLISNNLISDMRPSNGLPSSDKTTTNVGGTTFWEENGVLWYYPEKDLSSDEVESAINALGFDNAEIIAIHRSDTKPDDMSKATNISAYGSNTPIYLWKDGETLYWWSQARHPALPQWSSWLFANYPKLTDISGLADFNALDVYSAASMFKNDRSLADLTPIANWDVSNIATVNSLFKNCASVEDLNALSEWRFSSNLKDMSSMLNGCSSLDDIKGMANWNAKPTNIQWLLCGATITNLDGIEGIDPSTPGAKIRSAFSDLKSLTDISALSAWDDKVSAVDPDSGLWALFAWDSSLTNLDGLQGWKLNGIKTLKETFAGCNVSGVEQLANWNVSSVETMERTFAYNQNITTLKGLENWDVSNVNRFSSTTYDGLKTGMFLNCTSLKDISALRNWNTSNLVYSISMFYYCDDLVDLSPLANWHTGKLQKADGMFYGCWRITSPTYLANWDTSSLQTAKELFGHCGLTTLTGLENWNTGTLTDINGMFKENELKDVSAVSSWFNASNQLTSVANLFAHNNNLEDIKPLKKWNVSNVTDFSGMFEETGIASVEALSDWDTSNAENLTGAFKKTLLKTLSGLENWRVLKVEKFQETFADIASLTDASAINDWDISKGTIFYRMFHVSGGTAVIPEFSKRSGKFDADGTFIPDN